MYVKSVHFENIKVFADQKFEFGSGDNLAGWNVFVGGNASGKSTILKGIALSIAGPSAGFALMDNNTQGWISQGALKGSVNTELVWESTSDTFRDRGNNPGAFIAGVRWVKVAEEDIPQFRSIEHRSSNGSKIKSPERGPWNPNAQGWFCAGYGPWRRLTGSSANAVRFQAGGGAVSRMVTLFREDAALAESEQWLRNLNYGALLQNGESSKQQTLYDGVIAFLNSGLLPQGFQLDRLTVEQVILKNMEGLELPMRDLSDGCRSIYALILDLIHSFYEVYGTTGLFKQNVAGIWQIDKPGVVLIDEIEAHLHPAWQQVLPEWLKARFPKVQFIVTTHSPLIVQAADPGGVYVLPLQNEPGREARRLDDHEYQKLKWGKAEKVLLGSAFGLRHTRSRWAVDQIDRWKWLNAKAKAGVAMSTQEKSEHRRLAKQLQLEFESEG